MIRDTSWIIADELNVKKVDFCEDEEELVKRSCKANFKVLGARLGKEMKLAAARIAALTAPEISAILNGKPLQLTLSDNSVAEISAADLIINREERPGLVASSENGVTIALETALNDELEAEGLARELVSKLQNLRKECGFEVTDRINILYTATGKAAAAVEKYREYISGEVLGASLQSGPGDTELDINGEKISVSVSKA